MRQLDPSCSPDARRRVGFRGSASRGIALALRLVMTSTLATSTMKTANAGVASLASASLFLTMTACTHTTTLVVTDPTRVSASVRDQENRVVEVKGDCTPCRAQTTL